VVFLYFSPEPEKQRETVSAACGRARYRFNLLRFDLPLKQTVKNLRCFYYEQDL
jgi:hypothetical protein